MRVKRAMSSTSRAQASSGGGTGRLRTAALLLLATLVGGWISAQPLPAQQENSGRAVFKVMTYNVDEGTDFEEALAAALNPNGTLAHFAAAVQLTLDNVRATNPPLRAQALASEIARTQPDLVSLQEVTIWRVGPGPNPTPVEFDFLQLILDRLAAEGQHYAAVAVVPEFDLKGPLPDFVTFVEAQNRDVILARTDLPAMDFTLSNTQTAHFSVVASFPTLFGPITITRGWASVDANLHGQSFRFVATHLEQGGISPLVQRIQALELIATAGSTPLPVVFAGDFNSDADNPNDPTFPTYAALTGPGGLADAWIETRPGDPGFTCCQAPLVNNPVSQLNQRVDFILFRGGVTALASQLAGDSPQEMIGGLWPSDHAGVRAVLQF